jgi:hypothetical protein
MFALKLEWKPFNVSLQAVDAQARAVTAQYVGNSADTCLTLWFLDEPTSDQQQGVRDYWDRITEQSVEATSYVSQEEMTNRIRELRSVLAGKAWDEMSAVERKIALGLTVTREDLGM